MAEFFVWLLISTGGGYYNGSTLHTIAQVKTLEECQRVQKVLGNGNGYMLLKDRTRETRCVEVKIYK